MAEWTLPAYYPTLLLVAIMLPILAYVQSVSRWRARSRGLSLPPGPPPLPIVGNMFNIPKVKAWYDFQKLAEKYGDIIHFRAAGQSVLVLGSEDAMSEYLNKRSQNTSDRKQTIMIELTGSEFNFAFMSYGTRWRNNRRAFWQHFHQDASVGHRPIQLAAAHIFLDKLLTDPTRLKDHIRYTFGASVMKVVYGIEAKEEDDEFVTVAEAAVNAAVEGLEFPGKFFVEYFPFLRHIPAWFPGASSQRLFEMWQAVNEKSVSMPYAYAKENMDSREVQQSMVGRLLSSLGTSTDESERSQVIRESAAVAFEAGSDTTFSTLQAAFLALSRSPSALKRAQAELDAVVGHHRLPNFDDETSLVYVKATILEALRWHNVVPMGVAHASLADDELRGWFIPAGTIILSNIWACMHDPEVYPDPDEFRPERFIRDGKIDETVRSPLDFVFGFGRRICPGRYFAQAGLFINIASALHVFDVTSATDENGHEIKVEYEMTPGFLSYPADCRCTIKPRFPGAEELIRTHAAAARAGQVE